MKHEDIYNLSMRFAPPKVDLRQAQIQDDYGDESFAKLIINHKKPDDVTRKEFDYYGWVYPFMGPEDLLFYLYAMVIEFSNDQEIDCIESFMYSMDREISELQTILSNEEQQILKNAFQQIWDISGHDYIVFAQCENLQKLIGITVDM